MNDSVVHDVIPWGYNRSFNVKDTIKISFHTRKFGHIYKIRIHAEKVGGQVNIVQNMAIKDFESKVFIIAQLPEDFFTKCFKRHCCVARS